MAIYRAVYQDQIIHASVHYDSAALFVIPVPLSLSDTHDFARAHRYASQQFKVAQAIDSSWRLPTA